MPSIRSRHLISALLASSLLSACSPGGIATLQQDFTLAAQEQLKRTLANQYTRELGKGVNLAMNDLAQVGGYLDNPLVRILLPPPLGIALGVARDLHANPQAAVLETLMNRAAEQVIPGAGPILQTAVAQITPAEARALLDGGSTAGSDFLHAKTRAHLRAALAPQISQQLGGNGALEIYSGLLASTPAASTAAPELDAYVTDKAIDGMFKNLGAQEARLRDNLDAATGGLLPGPVKPATAEPAPAQSAPVAPAAMEAAPVESAPVEAAPVPTAPVAPAPVQVTPVESTAEETTPKQTAPVEAVPAPTAPVETAPVEPAPVKPTPEKSVPQQTAPEDPSPAPETEAAPLEQIWM